MYTWHGIELFNYESLCVIKRELEVLNVPQRMFSLKSGKVLPHYLNSCPMMKNDN